LFILKHCFLIFDFQEQGEVFISIFNFILQKTKMAKTAIIGSGIGGLATAIRLAVKGHEVHVYEANAYPGGKLAEIQQEGFRFDAGPSLFTLPSLVDELFVLAGKNPSDYFEYQKLDEVCRYFWDDGQRLTVTSDIEKFDADVCETFGEKKGAVIEYLKQSAFKYESLNALFLQSSLHKLSTWISKDAFKGYLNLSKMGIFGTLHHSNRKTFSSGKMVQLFDRYATYNGSDPYQTPATMGIIPHLEYNIGAFFPKNGMISIPQSIYKLGIDLGVQFHFNNKVKEIKIEKEKVTGVVANEGFVQFENVVSNMDVTPTYRKLMPKEKAPDKILNQEKSGSGLIFYWGIKNDFLELGLHNIFFSNNYEAEFKSQFSEGKIYEDPTVYVNITSKIEQKDAPEGQENWFVLINAPSDKGQNWDEIIKETRENVIKKLSHVLKVDFKSLIVCENILDPRLIQSRTSSSQGALYGNSSNNKFAAFLRHPNFSKKIQNLYFVGGSVHPGGGIPLALSSAKITSDFLA
jgi:phytoene desaturase